MSGVRGIFGRGNRSAESKSAESKPADRRDGKRTPGYSWCFRCGTSWDKVAARVVEFGDGRGSFALCRGCWVETIPSERLVFHVALWAEQRLGDRIDPPYPRVDVAYGDVADLVHTVRCVMGASDLVDDRRWVSNSEWFPLREAMGQAHDE